MFQGKLPFGDFFHDLSIIFMSWEINFYLLHLNENHSTLIISMGRMSRVIFIS